MFNFFLTDKFVNEQLQNVILLGKTYFWLPLSLQFSYAYSLFFKLEKLRYVISLSVESLESNYLISYKKMFPASYPGLNLTWY